MLTALHDFQENLQDQQRELEERNEELQEQIEERQRIEEALLQERDKLEKVTQNVGAGLCIISKDYKVLWVNKVLTDIYGEVVGKTCHTTFNQQTEICSFCGVRPLFEEGKELTRSEALSIDKNGDVIYCELIATPIHDEKGNITSALEVVIPITESKQREKALGQLLDFSKTLTSSDDLATLYRKITKLGMDLMHFDFSTLMIVAEDRNSLVIRDTIGFPESTIGTYALLKGQGLSTYVVEHKKAAVVYDFSTEDRFEVPPLIFEYGITSSLCVPMMVGDEVFGVLIGHSQQRRKFTDVEVSIYQSFANQAAMAIKNATHLQSLHASETKFRSLFDSTNDALMIYAMDGTLIEVNEIACSRLGYTRQEMLALKPEEFIAPKYAASLRERIENLRQRGEAIFETAHVRKNGSVIPIELSCKLIEFDGKPAMLGLARDISQRKKIETERLRTQKLESVGILAGGIAHDFNNLLTGIMGNVSLAKTLVQPTEEVYEKLSDTEKAAYRARDLTQQLLTFSKGGAPIKEAASISGVIKDSTKFALRGSKSVCEYDFPADLWMVNADKGQLSQVFQNLAINASQAMPEGGVIEISARNVELKRNGIPDLEPGKYIKIVVQDHGTGVSQKHVDKIFDPYFSTKQNGSGLGLAVVFSIIKNHQGHIALESKPGKGTTFYIHLPSVEAHEEKTIPETDKTFIGKGKVLIMDDEELVQNVATKMLQKLGYEPDIARDGKEALSLYEKAKEDNAPFDVVIMDLTIPAGMGGKEAIGKLLDLDPDATAIVSSGYANDPIMAGYKQYGFKGVIPKPFTVQELSKILKKVAG